MALKQHKRSIRGRGGKRQWEPSYSSPQSHKLLSKDYKLKKKSQKLKEKHEQKDKKKKIKLKSSKVVSRVHIPRNKINRKP